MKLFRVLFTSSKGQNINHVVRANDVNHAVKKASDKFDAPNGFSFYEGFEGNCKIGKKLA